MAFEVTGAGPPVVFLHGICLNSLAWRPVVERVSRDVTAVTIDLPGHGFSDEAQAYTYESTADAVHAVVRHLGLSQPLVVGHSLGAVIATIYAAQHDVLGVVNVDQTFQIEALGGIIAALRPRLRTPDFYTAMDEIKGLFGLDALDANSRALVEACWNPAPRPTIGYWEILWSRPLSEVETHYTRALEGIARPYLSIHGLPIDPGYDDWLHRFAPQAVVESWAGGHFPHLKDPQRFAARVRALAARVPAP